MAAANPEGVIGFYQTTPVPSSPLPVLEMLSSDLAFRQRQVHESDCVRPPSDRVQPSPESYLADYPAPQPGASSCDRDRTGVAIAKSPAWIRCATADSGSAPSDSHAAARSSAIATAAGAGIASVTRSEGSWLEVPIERQPQTTAGRISITATDDTGRWIQDLRKQDLNLYEDGIQRPVLSLQRDVETPASIGIVVDTSGSMSWKLAAGEAALQAPHGCCTVRVPPHIVINIS